MKNKDIDGCISLWAELVDMGEVFSLEMIKNTQPESDAITVFKEALTQQSESHHQANIEILSKLTG